MNLWDITESIDELSQQLDDISAEIGLSDEEIETRCKLIFEEYLSRNELFEIKANQVGAKIKELEALSTARAMEAKRLSVLAKRSKNQAQRLRLYLSQAMATTGKTRIDGSLCTLSLRPKPSTLRVTIDVEDLPIEYKRVVETPDIPAIKQAINSGQEIDFADSVPGDGFSVSIY